MADPLTRITTSLKTSHIIPDVIPSSAAFSPSVLFTIVWPSSDTEVMLGGRIEREATLQEPEVKIEPMLAPSFDETADSAGASYTLVMTDPDAPSRAEPKYGEWRHWIVTGMTLPSANAVETEASDALKTQAATTPYHPPGPPPGSGLHRYTFLLFQEPLGGIVIPSEASSITLNSLVVVTGTRRSLRRSTG